MSQSVPNTDRVALTWPRSHHWLDRLGEALSAALYAALRRFGLRYDAPDDRMSRAWLREHARTSWQQPRDG